MRGRGDTRIKRALSAAAISWTLVLLLPAAAAAACTPAQRADAAALARNITQLRTSATPAATSAAALGARARRSCADLRIARAITQATLRVPAPVAGTHRRVLDIELEAVHERGIVVWRLDTTRLAARYAKATRARSVTTLRGRLNAARFGSRTMPVWSNDPTRIRFDVARQSAVAIALTRSARRMDRTLAGHSVQTFTRANRVTLPAREPLLRHLYIANQIALAAQRSGSKPARTTARRIGLRALARMRGASARNWSRINGAWSSARQHRTLTTRARTLVKRVPHAASARVVTKLTRSLKEPTGIDFGTLPKDAFYPWPKDGAFDTQAVTIDIDKPATLTLTIYQPSGTVVRTIETNNDPGPVTLTWDGTATDDAIQDAGAYRYNIDAVDRLGNKVRVPGLEQFTIARDTTKPTFKVARARYMRSGGTPRIIASWEVEDVHSPQVRTWLILRRGSERTTLKLHDRVQKATVRRNVSIAAGTWTATFVFVDGSGNRTSHRAGEVVVR